MHNTGTTLAGRFAAAAVLAAVALIPSVARADDEIPAGHFYIGLTGELAQPLGRALVSRDTLGLGSAYGLYLHYEGAHFLVGAEITGGTFKNDDTFSDPRIVALRGGPIFGSGPYWLYVAAGPALLAYGAFDDNAAAAMGFTGEVGVLLFRQMRWFRATAFVQYNLPVWSFDVGRGRENVTSLSWAALGLRLQF